MAGLYLTFVGLGATGAVIPAALPTMAQIVGVPTAALLPAVPVLFAGLFVGVAVAPVVVCRVGAGRTVAAGALLQALSLAGLAAAATTGVVITASAIAGVGFGIAESGGTALTRTLTASTSRTLTGLTAASAAAAACTPLAVVATGPDTVALVLCSVAVPPVLAAVTLGRPGQAPPLRPAAGPTTRPPTPTRWVAVALFCYVGAETVLAGWSAALAQTSFELSPGTAALGTSAFWVLLMTGRLVAAAAIRGGAAPGPVLTACQLGAAASLAAGSVTATVWPATTVLSATFVGVSVVLMGPCYALLLSTGIDAVGTMSTGTKASGLVAAGALGGAAWAAAVASTTTPLNAITVTVAACLGMAASRGSCTAGRRRWPRSPTASADG